MASQVDRRKARLRAAEDKRRSACARVAREEWSARAQAIVARAAARLLADGSDAQLRTRRQAEALGDARRWVEERLRGDAVRAEVAPRHAEHVATAGVGAGLVRSHDLDRLDERCAV